MAATFNIQEHVLESSHIREYWRATSHSQEEPLKIHIKQYTPKDNPEPQPGDVTIIGAHANGFPKELYEAFWEQLYAASKSHGWRIRSIWMADVAQQGASSVLNEHHLGNDPSWYDHSRDLLHMINTFRQQMPLPVVAIGHSMGGCQLSNLALFHPRLFTTIVLLDPVIQSQYPTTPASEKSLVSGGYGPARSSTFRRDVWPSRKQAAEAFLKTPFYQSWDKKVFEAWLQYGLRDTPTVVHPEEKGSVTLTCTKHNEVTTFLRPAWNQEQTFDLHPSYATASPAAAFYRHEITEVFDRLPSLRPPVLYIFGGASPMSGPAAQEAKLKQTGTGFGGSGGVPKGKVASVTLEGIGHLVAMETPQKCAENAAPWIGKELENYRRSLASYQEWSKLSQREKATISKDWEDKIGRPVKPAKKSAASKL